MATCGKGKLVTFGLVDRRLVTLDLDDTDDWGDIRIEQGPRVGAEKVLIGNDEDGWVEADRFWEEIDKEGNCEDYIDRKWQTFFEVSKDEVIAWVSVRMLPFCDGYTMDDLAKLLLSYGIDIGKIYIPKEWKE